MSELCVDVHHLDNWFDDSRVRRETRRRGPEHVLRDLREFTEAEPPAKVIYFEPATVVTESLAPEFAYHAAKWATETAHLSSVQQMMEHPSYKRIMVMAEREPARILPLILIELQARPNHWFNALMKITGENPVRPRDAGRFDKMVKAWLDWGRKQHLLR